MSETYRVPSECPNCGSSIEFGENTGSGETVILCVGGCGEWRVLRP